MSELSKTALFAGFDATITANGNNEITGPILNAELKNIGDSYPNKLDEDHYFLREYNTARAYSTGFVCIQAGVIYKANKATSGTFTAADWDNINASNNGIYTGNGSLAGSTTVTMATNNLLFASTGEANLLHLDATNDLVGIGTAPTATLHVKATTPGTSILFVEDTAGDDFLQIDAGGAWVLRSDGWTQTLGGNTAINDLAGNDLTYSVELVSSDGWSTELELKGGTAKLIGRTGGPSGTTFAQMVIDAETEAADVESYDVATGHSKISLSNTNISITSDVVSGPGLHYIQINNTGINIGAAANKIGFYGTTPVLQPTTAITASAFVANTSGISDDTATFGGYTIGQIVAAAQDMGLLA